MVIRFDLTDFQLFVNIAEANSLTKGAARTYMSLPTASNRIKNLEDNLGTKLLFRTHQGVALSPSGQTYLHHARLVLAQLQRCHDDLQEYVRGVKGHVRIFANTNAITEFLPSILPAFLETHPGVNIDLSEQLSNDIVRAVSDGKTDIGIVAGNVRTEGLEVLPFRKDRLVLAMSPVHPLADRNAVAFEETLEFDYVGLSEASAMQIFLNQIANNIHQSMKIRIQAGNFETICRMVEKNVGIAILPETAANRHRKNMQIHVSGLIDAWAQRDLKICVRSMHLLPAFTRDLVELLMTDGRGQ